jgi:cell division protein FtsB
MREFQERRRLKRLLHSRYAIIAMIVLLLLLGRAVWGIYSKYERSREIAERVKADLVTLEEREKILSKSIESLSTEEGKERELRDRFGVVKEGERLVVLVDADESGKNEIKPVEKSWWQGFLDIFR